MDMPISDVVDRYTILQIKLDRFANREQREKILEMYRVFEAEVNERVKKQPELMPLIEAVREANADLWDAEAAMTVNLDLRNTKGIARIARKIRQLNTVRIEAKNAVSAKVGDFYRDLREQY